MISIRIPVLSRLLCVAAVSAMLTLTTAPADAQQATRNGNNRIGTIGDLAAGKLNPNIRRLRGLNFATLGLFGDAEVFGQFNAPRPFIFPLPDFSGAGLDFTGVSFDEYLTLVANSYRLTSSADYLLLFQFQNEVSALNPDFVPTFNQVIQAHQQDFLAGGGFLPFGAPTIPTPPAPEPEPFVPFEPVFTTPLVPVTTVTQNTSSAGLLAAEIAPGDTLNIASPHELSLDLDTGLVVLASASQPASPAANVSVVPEPATLGLLTLGATALLTRSRRR